MAPTVACMRRRDVALKGRLAAISGAWIALTMLISATTACRSGPAATALHNGSATADANPGAHIDLLCIGDRINSPSEPFHYSFKYSDDANSVANEADITPQKMDITSTDRSGTHSYHGVRTDEASWNAAVLDLSSLKFTGMSARIDSLNGTSSIASLGPESINGYTTTKYSIDTTRASSADQRQFQTLFGAGSFEKGSVWIPADGCAVKLDLDESVVMGNGKVTKARYEVALTRK